MADNPTESTKRSYSYSKSTLPLKFDPQIVQDLTVKMLELGWNFEPDQHTILFTKGERCLIYLRRMKLLQIYWMGYGTQAIEADLFSFDSPETIVKWSEQLNDQELIAPVIDLDDLEDLDPMDIIDRIFD
jgi:hypothetical protein